MKVKFCKYCNCDHPSTKEFWYFKGSEPSNCKIRKAAYRKEYYETNRDKCLELTKISTEANKEKYKQTAAVYYQKNKDNIRESRKGKYWEYEQKRLETDVQFKLTKNLRRRLRSALVGNYKSGSAINDLGCSITELRTHLESKFTKDMTWENYGSYWSIDHKRPLASFDLSDRNEFLIACHYTNLQPLTVTSNSSKGSKYEVPQGRNLLV